MPAFRSRSSRSTPGVSMSTMNSVKPS